MSEPQMPPPPAPGQPAKKKGLSTVAKVLIGCLGLLLLAFLAMGACGIFFAKKASDFAEDLSENPGKAAAELAVRFNPDLEMVEADDDAETITVRNKETGEEMTFDWSDFAEDGFSIRTDEGEINFQDPSNNEDGAVISMTDADGNKTTVVGGEGSSIPSWAPRSPGASDVQGTFSTTTGDRTSGAFQYTTSETVSEVLDYFDQALKDLGYETSKTTFNSGGEQGGSVSGTHEGDGRSLSAMVGTADGTTQVNISYNSGG